MNLKLVLVALAVSGCSNKATLDDVKPQKVEVVEKTLVLKTADNETSINSESTADVLRGIHVGSLYYPPEVSNCEVSLTTLIKIGTPYEALRGKILNAGFVAYQDNEMHECQIHEDMSNWRREWCEENPEVEATAPTGTGPRLMTWQRDDVFMRVFSNGEEPIVSGVECRKL